VSVSMKPRRRCLCLCLALLLIAVLMLPGVHWRLIEIANRVGIQPRVQRLNFARAVTSDECR
jgi:hypothetical protein